APFHPSQYHRAVEVYAEGDHVGVALRVAQLEGDQEPVLARPGIRVPPTGLGTSVQRLDELALRVVAALVALESWSTDFHEALRAGLNSVCVSMAPTFDLSGCRGSP